MAAKTRGALRSTTIPASPATTLAGPFQFLALLISTRLQPGVAREENRAAVLTALTEGPATAVRPKKPLRACLKTLGNRRVRARGLQDLPEKPVACRPGALTGRVFKRALKRLCRFAVPDTGLKPGANESWKRLNESWKWLQEAEVHTTIAQSRDLD